MRQEAEPAATEIEEISDGVLRLQLPLRMPGLGHVNCYALEDERGWTVVDPGMPGPTSWKSLVERFGLAGFKLKHVHTVVVTHSHVDHFGASGRLREVAGAKVVTSTSFRTWWDPRDAGERELELADPKGDGEADEVAPAEPDPRHPWRQGTPWGGKHPRPPRKVRLKYRLLK